LSTEDLAGKPPVENSALVTTDSELLSKAPGLEVEELEDIDDIELRTAMADVGAEEPEGQLQPAEGGAGPDKTPPGGTAAEPGKDGERPKGNVVAKARFDEVLVRAKTAEENLARSQAEALELKRAVAQTRPPEVQPELVRIDTKIDDLAKKFDDGVITYAEMVAQQRPLMAQRDQIREDTIVSRATQRAVASIPAPSSADDGWLADRSKEVVDRYGPYIEAIPETMVKAVVEQARANVLAEHGKVTGARADALVRQEFGRLAEVMHDGFAAINGTQPIKRAGNGQPAARPTPGNQPTVEQRRAKLDLQERAHPSLSSMSRSTGTDTMLSEAQIEEMDEEAIAELPAATRKRLLGIE
jgi:hypothetical protein